MLGPALAGGAAAGGVIAAWDLLAGAEEGMAAVRRALAPLTGAGGDRTLTLGERRRVGALLAAALCGAGWLLAGPLPGLGLAAAGPLTARRLVARRRRRWSERLRAGAPALARAIADALSGGHSVRGAIAEAGRRGGLSGPAAVELRRAAHALELGEPTEPVLERLRERARSPAYDTLVAAVLLHREAGGDLAGLLRELAGSLEASVRLEREARAATAQARFTGGLVAALPFGALALTELAQPGFLPTLLGSPISAGLIAGAAVLQMVGLLAVRRLARVRP